jgi:hypothetical protein
MKPGRAGVLDIVLISLGGRAIFFLIFAKFLEIFAPFVMLFGAGKRMPGLPKTVPFFVAFRASTKKEQFRENREKAP